MKHIKLFEKFSDSVREARQLIPYDGSIDTMMVRNSDPYRDMIAKGYMEMPRPSFDDSGNLWLYDEKKDAGLKITRNDVMKRGKNKSHIIAALVKNDTMNYINILSEINNLLNNDPNALVLRLQKPININI
jgi:hypothetical protein